MSNQIKIEPSEKDNQATRCLKILEFMFGDVIHGYSNKDIITKLKYKDVDVCRALDVLKTNGWIDKQEHGRWVLTIKPVALIKKYNLYIDEIGSRLDNFEKRTNAHARR